MSLVVQEIRIRALRPAFWGLIDLLSESTYANRQLDASGVKEAARWQIVLRVPIKASRRHPGIRQPIERDVVENVVAGKPFRLAVENAGDHLIAANVVVEHPG